jgi:hypothetical protein
MLEDFDKQVSILSETFARLLSRRKMLGTAVKGVFATVAAATHGQFANVGEAFAFICTCNDDWRHGRPCLYCRDYGYRCPWDCIVCTNRDWCGGWCNWYHGRWIACHHLGVCGHGYRICTDCMCGDCDYRCTCLSDCFCCYCCTAGDIRAERERLASLVD